MRAMATALAAAVTLEAGLMAANVLAKAKADELLSIKTKFTMDIDEIKPIKHVERNDRMIKLVAVPMEEQANCTGTSILGPYQIQHCAYMKDNRPTLVTVIDTNHDLAAAASTNEVIMKGKARLMIYDLDADGLSPGDSMRATLQAKGAPLIDYIGLYEGSWKQTWDLWPCEEFGPMPGRTDNFGKLRTFLVMKGKRIESKLSNYKALLGIDNKEESIEVLSSIEKLLRGRFMRRINSDKEHYRHNIDDYGRICRTD